MNRTVVLACLLAGSLCFIQPVNGWLQLGAQAVSDIIDGRPEKSALFIGNSRTFYHDMPKMVRRIADSAGYPDRLRIEMDAQPGVSLTDHQGSARTQALLDRRWDHVVLQVLSSEQYSADKSGRVWEAAESLIGEVDALGEVPAMFVTWRYTDQCTPNEGLPPSAIGLSPAGYENMHRNIQEQHARLAERTGVDLVNVGIVWEHLLDERVPFNLYDDCNHPSIYGSYLSALMFYSYFSGGDVSKVTYQPDEMPPTHAAFLRAAVTSYFDEQNSG